MKILTSGHWQASLACSIVGGSVWDLKQKRGRSCPLPPAHFSGFGLFFRLCFLSIITWKQVLLSASTVNSLQTCTGVSSFHQPTEGHPAWPSEVLEFLSLCFLPAESSQKWISFYSSYMKEEETVIIRIAVLVFLIPQTLVPISIPLICVLEYCICPWPSIVPFYSFERESCSWWGQNMHWTVSMNTFENP